MSNRSETLLEVRNLSTTFDSDEGLVKAVDGISFIVREGEAVGIVGESGCGKTVANLSILKLIPSPPGRIDSGVALFKGEDLLALRAREIRKVRGNRISMIFQDPMTSLNPLLRISRQMTEVLELHEGLSPAKARERAIQMLDLVGIPDGGKRIDDYPHQFSGGMRQRAMIAMALSCHPELLIADEPTTALDVTIQAQILDLIRNMREEFGMSLILITHDLGVVAGMCERILVMYAGRIVETGSAASIFHEPRHPYTIGLLRSVPRLDEAQKTRLIPIVGQPPDLTSLPAGCAFEPRCEFRKDRCAEALPVLRERQGEGKIACHFYEEIDLQGRKDS
ncbi:MAG: ABC transporter ATP-binding protein [Planctomycetota bacterium]|jgi:oligopeptide transport system ATP-binding protein